MSAYQGPGSQGDAGAISLYAPAGGVTLNGTVLGRAYDGGKGGSFSMVTDSLDIVGGQNAFSTFNDKLAAAGFSETLNFEAITGDITIPQGTTVSARSVTVTTDHGSISLSGKIDASQAVQGGTVALHAEQNLTVDSGGYIDASGAASGGNVTLAVDQGMLTLAGGTVDVSGGTQTDGGTVLFRDPPWSPPPEEGGNPTNMSLFGTIKGAKSVIAEVDTVYVNQFGTTDGSGKFNTTIDSAAISQITSDINNFMSANSGLGTYLASGLTDGNGNSLGGAFHFQPGIVVQSSGDITLSQGGWNLTNWRPGGEVGTISLRASGNLNINGNITDSPRASNSTSDNNNYRFLLSSTAMPSWSYNLVAGAQTASPNLLAVTPAGVQGATGGSLFIGGASNGNVVYTQTGSILFASGGNTVIYPSPNNRYMINLSMPYSLATYSGAIRGNVAGSLTIYPNAAIQSATGNIDLRIGRDLGLTGGAGATAGTNLGAIRTTGERTPSNTVFAYHSYQNGGSISLDVGGSAVGGLNANAWLYASNPVTTAEGLTYYPVTAVYSRTTDPMSGATISFTEGIAAMAGGSVSVRAGGDFSCQIGAFGEGDLQLYSGGDVAGRFLVKQGTGAVSAMGNFGVPDYVDITGIHRTPQLIEMGASHVGVYAQGNVEVGAVVNPNLAEPGSQNYWDNGYAPYSSIKLIAAAGDVNMYGYVDSLSYGAFTMGQQMIRYLPPSVQLSAGRDIAVSASFTQLPAGDGLSPQGLAYYGLSPQAVPYGNLTMQAGGDIVFKEGTAWVVSDADLNSVYPTYPTTSSRSNLENSHASSLVHGGDAYPATISAGGDITHMNVTLPKMANVYAGGSINDLNYTGQNVQPTDITSIIASQDVTYSYGQAVSTHAIQVGGPGYVLVQAGGKIDLGVSNGIQTIGNAANPATLSAGETGASLIVAAGVGTPLDPGEVAAFFQALRAAGIEYSSLKSSGDAAGAAAVVDRVRTGTINRFIPQTNNGGDITMTSSQISTVGGGSMFIFATGALNVGTTILASKNATNKSTGILTETGGAISVFAKGDVNVNEARLMTFQGGDITVWSDRGNVNAGKGDKTTISASTPVYSCDQATGVCSVKFTPPAVGSGIRALTYAADENTPPPPAGDIYLFAPQGIIDAGEAGISGGRIVLGATAILNASNISFTTGSVGLPAASQGVSLGALTGSSDLSGKNSISSDTGALAQAQERVASAQPIEDMVVKWIDVKVMSYDLTFGADEGPDDSDEGRNRNRDKK